ncbi:radical SAM family protein [Desulfobotulus alkaliphilus]|uniref:Radical SAM family protein n=1 Tax=Desulfobotulus alkaliphilus TaxID=622671 RepID=A0A562RYX2_9BACT|nr:SPASM domain-containing protein [Desulfobotulus alkaliphilus]TWI74295.1 radical SAM family protein [Desulfobotulus alkaliphilus]
MIFKKIYFEITSACNLSCPFCPPLKRESCFIGERDFGKVLDEIAGMTERVLLHVRGEPLLHPEFPSFIRMGQALGVSFEITTNGALLEGLEDVLLLPSLVQVNVSLHSLLANGLENQPRILQKIWDFARRAQQERPDLYINFRFWDMASAVDTPQNAILEQLERMYGFHLPNVNVKRKKSFQLSGRVSLHFDTEFQWPSMEDAVTGDAGFCYGLKNQIAILSNGVVTPCCLDAEGLICLGNAFHQPLAEILESPLALAIASNFDAYRLSEALCQRCSYIKRFSQKTLRTRLARKGREEVLAEV